MCQNSATAHSHRVDLGRALEAAVRRLRRPQGVAHYDVLPPHSPGLLRLSLQEELGLERLVGVRVTPAAVAAVPLLVPGAAEPPADAPALGRRAPGGVADRGQAADARGAAALRPAADCRHRMLLRTSGHGHHGGPRRPERFRGHGARGPGAARDELRAAAAVEAAVDEHGLARHRVAHG